MSVVLSVAGLGILALVNQFILTSCPYSIYDRNLAMSSQSLLKSALTTPLEFKACSPFFTHPMQRYVYNLHQHTQGARNITDISSQMHFTHQIPFMSAILPLPSLASLQSIPTLCEHM